MLDPTPFFLGAVEGLTEFLPISSTAHLILARDLAGLAADPAFDMAIQIGAILAVIFFEWRRIFGILKNFDVKFAGKILVAFLPVATVGAVFHDVVTENFFTATVVGWAGIAGGAAMILAERGFLKIPEPRTADAGGISWEQSLAVGAAQVLSLIPGMSRAMTSILGGMAAGVGRAAATEFSFLVGIPVLGGVTFFEIFLDKSAPGLGGDPVFWATMGVSFVAAFLSLAVFWRVLGRVAFEALGWYRVALGVAALIFIA